MAFCCCGGSANDAIISKCDTQLQRLNGLGLTRGTTPRLRRSEVQVPVMLNVYSLLENNKSLAKLGMGVYHTGVVVYGIEWGYGEVVDNVNASGLFCVHPGQAAGQLFRTLRIGYTTRSPMQVDTILHRLENEWRSSEYHILHHNCNHFAQALCDLLSTTEKLQVPSWCNRAARLSDKVIPQRLATHIQHKMSDVPPKASAPPPPSNINDVPVSVIPRDWYLHPSIFQPLRYLKDGSTPSFSSCSAGGGGGGGGGTHYSVEYDLLPPPGYASDDTGDAATRLRVRETYCSSAAANGSIVTHMTAVEEEMPSVGPSSLPDSSRRRFQLRASKSRRRASPIGQNAITFSSGGDDSVILPLVRTGSARTGGEPLTPMESPLMPSMPHSNLMLPAMPSSVEVRESQLAIAMMQRSTEELRSRRFVKTEAMSSSPSELEPELNDSVNAMQLSELPRAVQPTILVGCIAPSDSLVLSDAPRPNTPDSSRDAAGVRKPDGGKDVSPSTSQKSRATATSSRSSSRSSSAAAATRKTAIQRVKELVCRSGGISHSTASSSNNNNNNAAEEKVFSDAPIAVASSTSPDAVPLARGNANKKSRLNMRSLIPFSSCSSRAAEKYVATAPSEKTTGDGNEMGSVVLNAHPASVVLRPLSPADPTNETAAPPRTALSKLEHLKASQEMPPVVELDNKDGVGQDDLLLTDISRPRIMSASCHIEKCEEDGAPPALPLSYSFPSQYDMADDNKDAVGVKTSSAAVEDNVVGATPTDSTANRSQVLPGVQKLAEDQIPSTPPSGARETQQRAEQNIILSAVDEVESTPNCSCTLALLSQPLSVAVNTEGSSGRRNCQNTATITGERQRSGKKQACTPKAPLPRRPTLRCRERISSTSQDVMEQRKTSGSPIQAGTLRSLWDELEQASGKDESRQTLASEMDEGD